ncbi:YpdA family putative bacillithiol disulfide reductase [Granulicella cerasi]|uniref:YpdA family putative bacillithiol disulfide reductase n=1 Tax=Granulicella cerasi TaxID=741063 RepID=A0ABW1ZCP0_9BACT|nr:YpdA family putative bacillithiol disulfide reductase [Granulicella cerasi]
MSEDFFDVLVIGAGPTGLACAIDAQNVGLRVGVVDKGCLTNSLFHYPANMVFFTTPELLEIGNIPFPSPNQKPTRAEALEYYRKVAQHYRLDTRLYESVKQVSGSDGDFSVQIEDRFGRAKVYRAKKLIVSTGYYDRPNYLGIPGEELSKVEHYYDDPHPFYNQDVLVIGGKNSAAIAALELYRHGARVTLIHRGAELHRHIKYWIKPDIENRIKNGEVQGLMNTTCTQITEDTVTLQTPEGERTIKNDFVFALTGYQPDFSFIESMGVHLDPDNARCPVCNKETLESNVAGIYLAGVVVAGERTNEVFIENGRFHGALIAADLAVKLKGAAAQHLEAPSHTVAAE